MRRGNLGANKTESRGMLTSRGRPPCFSEDRVPTGKQAWAAGLIGGEREIIILRRDMRAPTSVGAPVICNLRALSAATASRSDRLQDRSISERQSCVTSHNRPRRAMIRRVIDGLQFRMRNIRTWISKPDVEFQRALTLYIEIFLFFRRSIGNFCENAFFLYRFLHISFAFSYI